MFKIKTPLFTPQKLHFSVLTTSKNISTYNNNSNQDLLSALLTIEEIVKDTYLMTAPTPVSKRQIN